MIRRGWYGSSPLSAVALVAWLTVFCAPAAIAALGGPADVTRIGLPPVEYRYQQSRPYVPDGKAAYVPNEYIIHCLPGTTISMVRNAVDGMGGTLVRALTLPDTYLIRMGREPSPKTPRYFVAGAVSSGAGAQRAAAYASYVIDSIQPNIIYRPCVEPNDPYWGRQWDMVQIKMPGAWGIEKGSESVTVAVIDSGVAYTHPDLINRCVPGVDTFDNDYDPFDYPPGDGVGHGTHVAGIIAAQGDNSEGICGVAWNGVKIMPVRALGPIDDQNTAGSTETITSGMEWAMTHGAHVVNMSIGGSPRSGDAVYRAKIAQLAKAGIIVCIAAGNTGATALPDVNLPGLYPEAICVAATKPDDEIANYSSYGPAYEVDIAAPGGQMYLDSDGVLQDAVWSTFIDWVEAESGRWLGFYSYTGMQGTSMASPHVAGAAALLLSQGIPANQVRSRLLQSARVPAEPIAFDRRKYGAGILDVQAALSNAGIKIVSPARGATVEPDPTFNIALRGLNNTTVKVYVDYATDDGTPTGSLAGETPIIDGVNAALTNIQFKWSDYSTSVLAPGVHYMYVTAFPRAGGSPVSDWVMFQVAEKKVAGGLHLFSFPFILDTAAVLPTDILPGTDFSIMNPNRSVLKRYMASLYDYATYIPGISTDMAWVNPMFGSQPTGGGYYDLVRLGENGAVLARLTRRFGFPAGAGFWLILPNQPSVPLNASFPTLTSYTTHDGYVFDAMKGFSIPLHAGWNMVGNPYTHAVPWRTVKLTYQGETKSLQEAADAGWVLSSIFAYRTTGTPGYDRLSERDNLEPFAGYWLRAFVGSTDPTRSLTLTIRP